MELRISCIFLVDQSTYSLHRLLGGPSGLRVPTCVRLPSSISIKCVHRTDPQQSVNSSKNSFTALRACVRFDLKSSIVSSPFVPSNSRCPKLIQTWTSVHDRCSVPDSSRRHYANLGRFAKTSNDLSNRRFESPCNSRRL